MQPQHNVLKYLRYLRTLHMVWSLVRRRVTRRLPRLLTMYNVLKYRKTWWKNDKISIYWNRNGTAIRQFNKDQYYILSSYIHVHVVFCSLLSLSVKNNTESSSSGFVYHPWTSFFPPEVKSRERKSPSCILETIRKYEHTKASGRI